MMDMSKEVLAVWIAGAVTVLGALTAAINSIITTWRAARVEKLTEKVAELNTVQDKKLDHITILVDGRYGDVLNQLAAAMQVVARLTGTKVDQDLADTAQQKADEQNVRVAEAGKSAIP